MSTGSYSFVIEAGDEEVEEEVGEESATSGSDTEIKGQGKKDKWENLLIDDWKWDIA